MKNAKMKPETRLEMARGMLSILQQGGVIDRKDLTKRFPNLAMNYFGQFNPETNSYDVTISVTPDGYDGEPIAVTEDIWQFPSDALLTQLALLNG